MPENINDFNSTEQSGMEELSFEAALARLDEVVNHLERGDRPLDESLSLFEQGAALSNAAIPFWTRPNRRSLSSEPV